MNDKIVIFGAGDHAKVVFDAVECEAKFSVAAFIDLSDSLIEFCGRPVITLERLQMADLVRGIVAVGDNWLRSRIVADIVKAIPDFKFVNVIHPSVAIAKNCQVGEGSVIMAGVVLNPGVQVGHHCIINTGSILDHDVVAEDFSSVGPGCTAGGKAMLGAYSALCLGANVLHGRSIGEHSVVGAGALVTNPIPSHCVAYGVPCKVVRSRAIDEKYL